MQIIFKNETFDLDLLRTQEKTILNINGTEKQIAYTAITNNIYNLEFNNKNITAYTAEDENNIYVNIAGENFTFTKAKEEEIIFGSSDSATSDKDIVKPPMPGSVVKVLVEKNQSVKEGNPLIIIEAMKMETTLYSSIDGIVTEINVTGGEQVDSDKILLIVEKEQVEA